MMKPKLRHLPLAAAALVTCMGAQAGYTSPDGNFSLSGFGTLGLVRTNTDDAGFNYPGQGGGVNKHFDMNPDSKLALQGTYKFNPSFSLTSQLMTKFNAEGQYAPSLEWVFAKWQITPSISARFGRMGAPYFAISDFRDVGYANLTVRPPLDVYGQVPVSQFEGIDVSHQATFGSATLTSTIWLGDSHSKFAVRTPDGSATSEPTKVDIKQQKGINFNMELDNGLTMRFGRVRGKLSVLSNGGTAVVNGLRDSVAAQANASVTTLTGQIAALTAAINSGAFSGAALTNLQNQLAAATAGKAFAQSLSASATSMADTYAVNSVEATFTGFALTYDPGPFVFNLEYTKRTTKSYISDTNAWYGTFGYRVGKFTPYVGASRIDINDGGETPFGFSPTQAAYVGQTAQGAALVAGAKSILQTQQLRDRTTTVGVRWDAANNIALKAQFDRISKPANAQGVLFEGNSGFIANPRKVNVLSFSADFVF